MKFSALPQEIQDALNAKGTYLAKFAAEPDENGDLVIEDSIRLGDTPEDKQVVHDGFLAKGYQDSNATNYFQFVSRSLSDADALKVAEGIAAK